MQLIINKALISRMKIATAIILLYILSAWLLGSFAVMLYDLNKGLYYFKKPLAAAVDIPFSEALTMWILLNIIAGIVIAVFIAFTWIKFPEIVDKVIPKKLDFSQDPTCGTSGWMKTEDISKTFRLGHGPGILLGSIDNKPIRLHGQGRLNNNIMVFGAPGCGKTYSEIIPNCLQAVDNKESKIITDPKSEIARETLEFFKKHNYKVRVFNLVNMKNSDTWNPLDEIGSEDKDDVQLFCQVFITNTEGIGLKKGGDAFWSKAELNLFKSLVLYVKNERPKERQNLSEVYRTLASADGGGENALDVIFKSLEPNHPAKASYNIFTQAGQQAKGSVIQGLGIRLQVFANEDVKRITSSSNIDLEAPGKELCAYYCIISDTDGTYEFLSSLFFTSMFIKLTKLGDKSGGKCPVPVNFLLDEFCNIGEIPDFKKRIATMRSRGISCMIITQSLPQLKDRYSRDSWQEIISCCDTRLFLGVNDNDTARYLAESLGKGTIEQRAIRRDTDQLTKAAITRTPKARELLTTDETLRLHENKAVLIVRGREPLLIDKLGYPQHPLAGELTTKELSEYTPIIPEQEEITIEWGPNDFEEIIEQPEELPIIDPPEQEEEIPVISPEDNDGTELILQEFATEPREENPDDFDSLEDYERDPFW